MLLTEWGFPIRTVEAVRDHYLLREDDYENRFACLLNIAGGIVAAAGHALPGEYQYWETTPRKLEVLKLTTYQIAMASERARDAFESFRTHIDLGPLAQAAGEAAFEKYQVSKSSGAVSGTKAGSQVKTATVGKGARVANQAAKQRPLKDGGSKLSTSPWWRLSYTHWPLLARMAFFVLTLALVAGFSLACIAGSSHWPAPLRNMAVPLVQLRSLFVFATDLCAILIRSLPAPWLHSAAAIFAALYAAVFGLGALAYRLLFLRR